MPLPPGMIPSATSGCASTARPSAANRMSSERRNSLPPPRARPSIFPIVTFGMVRKRSTIAWKRPRRVGLAAGVWTRDVSKAHRVARAIRAGTVWVNCYNVFDVVGPFGGYKQSGYGRELSKYALDLYTQVKSVWLKV